MSEKRQRLFAAIKRIIQHFRNNPDPDEKWLKSLEGFSQGKSDPYSERLLREQIREEWVQSPYDIPESTMRLLVTKQFNLGEFQDLDSEEQLRKLLKHRKVRHQGQEFLITLWKQVKDISE